MGNVATVTAVAAVVAVVAVVAAVTAVTSIAAVTAVSSVTAAVLVTCFSVDLVPSATTVILSTRPERLNHVAPRRKRYFQVPLPYDVLNLCSTNFIPVQ